MVIMKKEEILNNIKELSKSQGFYGRLYEQLLDNNEALEYLESQNFKDILDLIMFLES
mgnify:CR=1 FL=1